MSIVLALESLYSAVGADFTTNAINAVNVFGWRELAKHQPAMPRVCWVPGDPSGALGETVNPRHPGAFPRPLGMLRELFTVYLTGYDPNALEDESRSYHVTRMLYEAWYRAVYRAAHGTFKVLSETWITDKTERRHGATLRCVCFVEAPIVDALPDEPLVGAAFAGLTNAIDAHEKAQNASTELAAQLDISLEDVTEAVLVAAEPDEG